MAQAGFIKSALCTVGSYTYVDYDSMAMKSQLHRGVQHSLAWFGIVVTVMLPLHGVVLNHVSMQGAVGASIALVVRVSSILHCLHGQATTMLLHNSGTILK